MLFPLLHLDLKQAAQLINISIFRCITLDYDCLFWFLISPELRQSAQLINISIFRWIASDSDFNGTENNSITDERYRLSHVSIIEQLIARAHTHTHARTLARTRTHTHHVCWRHELRNKKLKKKRRKSTVSMSNATKKKGKKRRRKATDSATALANGDDCV